MTGWGEGSVVVNRRWSAGSLVRKSALGGFWLALAVIANASDRVPVERPAADNSITAASRQLDSAKSNAAVSGSKPASDLPQFTVPQLPSGIDQPSLSTPEASQDAIAREKNSKNWLVEAMMKPYQDGDERKGDVRERRSRDGSQWRLSETGRRPDQREPNSAVGDRDGGERDRRDSAAESANPVGSNVNPFARYMAGWLSPQDYVLLRRTIDPAAGSNTQGTGSATAVTSVFGQMPPLSSVSSIGDVSGTDNRSFQDSQKPAENPYLQALAPIESALPSNYSANASAPAINPVPVSPPPQVEPSAKPRIPEFARPVSDDKYFKPLKRF